MIILTVGKSLEVILGGTVATNALPVVVNWIDVLASDQSVNEFGDTDTVVTGAAAIVATAAPGAGHTRTVKSLTVYNADTTGAQVTVRLNNGSTTRALVNILLGVGSTLEYVE